MEGCRIDCQVTRRAVARYSCRGAWKVPSYVLFVFVIRLMQSYRSSTAGDLEALATAMYEALVETLWFLDSLAMLWSYILITVSGLKQNTWLLVPNRGMGIGQSQRSKKNSQRHQYEACTVRAAAEQSQSKASGVSAHANFLLPVHIPRSPLTHPSRLNLRTARSAFPHVDIELLRIHVFHPNNSA